MSDVSRLLDAYRNAIHDNRRLKTNGHGHNCDVCIDVRPQYEAAELAARKAIADRIEALERALIQIRDICQDERLPCGQIFEIAEEALASGTPERRGDV